MITFRGTEDGDGHTWYSIRVSDQIAPFSFLGSSCKEEGKIRHLGLTPMGPAFGQPKKIGGADCDQLHQTFAVNKHPAMKLSGRICCIT